MTFAARIPSGCLWCSQAGTVCGDPPVRLGSFLCLAHDAIMGSHQDLVIAALEREPSVSVAALVAAAPAVVAPEPVVAVVKSEPKTFVPVIPAVRNREAMYDKEKMRALRRQGVSVRDIADRLGCSTALVYTATAGMASEPAKKVDPEEEPEPADIPAESLDGAEINRLLGLGMTVRKISDRSGVPTNVLWSRKYKVDGRTESLKRRDVAPAPALVPIPAEIRDPNGCLHLDESGKRCGRTIKVSGLCAGHAYDHDPQALFRPRRRRVSFSRMREILATTIRAWGSAKDFGARYGENETAISRAMNEAETYRVAFDRIVEKLGYRRIDEVTYEQFAVEPQAAAA